MEAKVNKSTCCGCGALLEPFNGPVHSYMKSSPACFSLFGKVLASEYSDPALLQTHRMTVDTYAVQHPGTGKSRREIQSVGLHLARLMIQLHNPLPPMETNDVMLQLGRYKATLRYIEPPARSSITIADVVPWVGGNRHAEKIQQWAKATWQDWSDHHDYIRSWVAECRAV
jgi:hypothetical protein